MVAEETARQRRVVAQATFDALNARRTEALEALITEDFEMHSLFAQVEGGAVYRGAGGLSELMAALDETWDDFRFEFDEVVNGVEKSVILYRVTGSARASGIPLDEEVAQVWTWRGDRVAHSKTYSSRDEALRSAGVEGF
jgi:ketosteroid isomerase-like protein